MEGRKEDGGAPPVLTIYNKKMLAALKRAEETVSVSDLIHAHPDSPSRKGELRLNQDQAIKVVRRMLQRAEEEKEREQDEKVRARQKSKASGTRRNW